MSVRVAVSPLDQTAAEFAAYQERRRRELWSLLGDLPSGHKPAPPEVVRTEEHEKYSPAAGSGLEWYRPVPALLLIPDHRERRAPGLLYIHWHAGCTILARSTAARRRRAARLRSGLRGRRDRDARDRQLVFWRAQRQHHRHQGEEHAFKLRLWRGQVLWGLMMFDEFRAFNYLAERPEVDASRLGVLGMSMGSTKAWWLGALEPRVRVVMDVCCLTDFDSLIAADGLSEHGVYYFVPSLLKHFGASGINELIVPRPRLSVNGRKDRLTPPAGVEHVRDQLMSLYSRHGHSEDCRIELFDCAHEELPEMRRAILAGWIVTWYRQLRARAVEARLGDSGPEPVAGALGAPLAWW